MIRVYTASKLSAAPMWKDLQKLWQKDAFFHARWLRHVEIETPDTPENAEDFWREDEEDIETADVLIVLARPEDHVRGALVEVGMALAKNVPVIVIGEHADYGTWQYHSGVTKAENFGAALMIIKNL